MHPTRIRNGDGGGPSGRTRETIFARTLQCAVTTRSYRVTAYERAPGTKYRIIRKRRKNRRAGSAIGVQGKVLTRVLRRANAIWKVTTVHHGKLKQIWEEGFSWLLV